MSDLCLRERLRAETRPQHDALERAVGIEHRITSRERYADHLVRLWRLHQAVELALQGLDFSRLGFSYPHPYRSLLLERDLAALGVGEASLRGLDLPETPPLETLPAGLGCLYVVEGSAKGARTLLPKINASLGLDAQAGASYFYGFGRETGALWRALTAAINAIDGSSADGDRAVRAAEDTFALFRDGLVAGETGRPPNVAFDWRPASSQNSP